ncbi:GLIPR1L1 [Branchiostoma lanceolatum]|uniref:GLIPR1L1 protein n=1 Tax=Branchiostoma lanceolatum TaxID=7740 RepID=A0A8J9ZQV0_BRALA|nr:GLIPR1L1 [Branchiostoma lanceolatum]
MRPPVSVLAVCLAFLVAAVTCAPAADDDDDNAEVTIPDAAMETPSLPGDVEKILTEANIQRYLGEVEPEDRKKRETHTADGCEDLYHDKCACRYWAADGACDYSHQFMGIFCQKSCGLCPPSNEEEVCADILLQPVCDHVISLGRALKGLAEVCCKNSSGLCPVIDPNEDEVFEQHCLEAHNKKRAIKDAPPMAWDPMCAQEARRYAKKLKARYDANPRSYPLEHSSQSERTWAVEGKNVVHGENLYWTWSDVPDCTGSSMYKNAIEAWYDEEKYYKAFRRNGRGVTRTGIRLYGHYTQIMWKETGAVGCGRSDNKPNNILVCYYQKGGNVYSTPAFNRNVPL